MRKWIKKKILPERKLILSCGLVFMILFSLEVLLPYVSGREFSKTNQYQNFLLREVVAVQFVLSIWIFDLTIRASEKST